MVNSLLKNAKIFGEYFTRYPNGLEELHGYELKEGNCVFSLG